MAMQSWSVVITADGYGGTLVAEASPTEQPLLTHSPLGSASVWSAMPRTDSAEAAGAFLRKGSGCLQKRAGGLARGNARHFPGARQDRHPGHGVGLDRLTGLHNHDAMTSKGGVTINVGA
jgi:hypothetical protein